MRRSAYVEGYATTRVWPRGVHSRPSCRSEFIPTISEQGCRSEFIPTVPIKDRGRSRPQASQQRQRHRDEQRDTANEHDPQCNSLDGCRYGRRLKRRIATERLHRAELALDDEPLQLVAAHIGQQTAAGLRGTGFYAAATERERVRPAALCEQLETRGTVS